MYNYLIALVDESGNKIYEEFYAHKNLYTENEFIKIIGNCFLNLTKEFDMHETTIGELMDFLGSELGAISFEPLDFEIQLGLPNVGFGKLKTMNKSPTIQILSDMITYENDDIKKEFDSKVEALKRNISCISWNAYNKDMYRAMRQIEQLLEMTEYE